MATKSNSKIIDRIGFSVSILCAIHCALMPVLITMLPLLGLQFVGSSYFELIIMAASLLLAVGSLKGSRHNHRSYRPLLLVVIGFSLMLTGHILEAHEYEWCFFAFGGVFVAVAHLINYKLMGHVHRAKAVKYV